MTTQLYQDMVRFASYVLPFNSVLEPADLVGEAYLLLRSTDAVLLKRSIKSLAFKERSINAGKRPISEIAGRRSEVIETTKVCRCCQQEKGFDSFRMISQKKNCAVRYYYNRCKDCDKTPESRRKDNERRHNPAYRQRANERERERYKERKMSPSYKEILQQIQKRKRENRKSKIASDPVFAEKTQSHIRAYRQQYLSRIKENPEAYASYRQRKNEQNRKYRLKQKLSA